MPLHRRWQYHGVTAVRIQREANPFSDRMRRYRVLLDGRDVGLLRWAETIEIQVEPGPHELRLKIDWTGSPTIPFSVTEGGLAEFKCRPRRPAALAIVSLFRSIRHRNEWLVLERV